jgi:hypothetical protein
VPGHFVIRRFLRFADHQHHFQEVHAQRLQHAVHLGDARFATFVQPMADAALGHADALSELCLSDFEFTHLGLDQLNPFIHVRHLTCPPSAGKTHIVVFKFWSQLRIVLS